MLDLDYRDLKTVVNSFLHILCQYRSFREIETKKSPAHGWALPGIHLFLRCYGFDFGIVRTLLTSSL